MPAIFVHGVTVRQERFDTILRKVTNEMSSVRPGMHVDGFYWGDRATSPTFRGLSIPELSSESDGDVRKKATTPEGVAGEGERWALLLEDPNVELIAIRDRQKFFTGEGLTTPTPENVEERNGILDRNRRQVADALASNALVLAGAGSPLDEKELVALVRSAFAAAKRAHRKYAAADLIEPLSRCLTASLYRHTARAAQALGGGFSWFKVERGVRQVLDDRLGEAKGALARAAKSATLSAFTSASRFGRRRLSDEWLIFCGDICAYLGRRDEILADLDGQVS